MATITFDTLKASRNLKAAGIAETQADAIVDTVAGAFADTVATKTDIARLEGRIDSGLANLKADLLKVAIGIAIGIILANAALTFAMLRLLLR